MAIIRGNLDRRAGRRLRLVLAVLVAAAVVTPSPVHSEIRPLVPEMLANLASVNEIGAGVSVGDFERVKLSPSMRGPERCSISTSPASASMSGGARYSMPISASSSRPRE
ncbi:MAG: hypothetical protein JRE57_13255 [Deltaproteobacteria bacterium]|nr:hypothetical protein [Deltaproteobacteria bacterium]